MKKYILRRIIPQNECPGTCCKKTGAFPASGTTRCIYFQEKIEGRAHGGCPFFNTDNSVNKKKLIQLSIVDQEKFNYACKNWPVPGKIPAFDTPYDTHFGRGFGDICPCFRWEVIDDGY
jgi:hypothetical protein